MRVANALTGAALLLAAPAAFAQSHSPPAEQVAAMRPFDLWVGDWKGSGWSISATGARTEFMLEETVQRRVGGTVLLVEGRGTSATGTVTHDGLSLVYYDAKTGRYHWNGHEIASGAVEAEPRLVDGGFEWSIAADGRGTTVRFTIRVDEKRWHEVGEVSVDGRTWNKFMEMNLLRQP